MASVRENFSKESIPHFSTIGQGMNSSVGDLRKVQAKDVATKISDLLNIAIFNKDIDGFVASQYKDITILIRDRSILKDLVDELKSQSIPFNVDSPTLIFEHRFTQMINSIVQSFLVLLSFRYNPPIASIIPKIKSMAAGIDLLINSLSIFIFLLIIAGFNTAVKIWRETSNGRLVSNNSGGFQPHSTKAPFLIIKVQSSTILFHLYNNQWHCCIYNAKVPKPILNELGSHVNIINAV